MNRESLIELVEKIIQCEGSEAEIDGWIELLERNVPHPGVSDLIYHDELSPEEIVDTALKYQSIQL